MFIKTLLKEYIKLVVTEILSEDIDMSRLSVDVVGVYAFAQAINKLIYEGAALPGGVPIDIIDAGKYLKSAPTTTKHERNVGMSFQYSGNSFKLYLDPTSNSLYIQGSNETHDLFHAFTANLAKAFGRRRKSIEKSGKFSITPSKFNKIKIPNIEKQKINTAFEKEYGFKLSDNVFEKPFEMEFPEYLQWFEREFFGENKIENAVAARQIARDLYFEIKSGDFESGLINKKYYIKKGTSALYDFSKYPFMNTNKTLSLGLESKPTFEYSERKEDEEELGNKMSDKISRYVESSKEIEDPEAITEEILSLYRSSTGLADEIKHRYDTPEVKNIMIKLFNHYNILLRRYKSAIKKSTT